MQAFETQLELPTMPCGRWEDRLCAFSMQNGGETVPERVSYVMASLTDFDDRSLRVFCSVLAFHKG